MPSCPATQLQVTCQSQRAAMDPNRKAAGTEMRREWGHGEGVGGGWGEARGVQEGVRTGSAQIG